MYPQGIKSQYKYRETKKRNPKISLGIFLISLTLLSAFISGRSIEFINSSMNGHYVVTAEQNDSNVQINNVELIQDTENKLYFDEEFYRSENINIIDKRVYVLEKYFESNKSPLVGHGAEFVAACDKYGAPKDCISLVAIAKHETNLCKYPGSADMFNCLGWGGGGSNRVKFNSYGQMIDRAMNVLVNQYGIARMEDPTLMEKVFCGPQDECIGWGNRVKIIMNNINNFSESLGVGKLK